MKELFFLVPAASRIPLRPGDLIKVERGEKCKIIGPSLGGEIRRQEGGRLVVRGDTVRASGGRFAVRRRQFEKAVGEGETGRVLHSSLRPARVPESTEGDDRGRSGQKVNGKV